MEVWQFVLSTLQAKQKVLLLYVLDNKGSSPGRKGFAMALAEGGQFTGTIGGGIMEVKLLELAKKKLQTDDRQLLIKQQFHDKKHTKNQSGLICSGEQTVALISLSGSDISVVKKIISNRSGLKIGLPDYGLQIIEGHSETNELNATLTISKRKNVHIFGGGHVGQALCQVLSLLGYYILLYDDRPDLEGFKRNPYANETHVVNYEQLKITHGFKKDDALVIVTSSYRTDKLVLKQIYQYPFAYIGMMGSDAKLKQLYQELENENINLKALAHIKAPIGLPIYSKTAMEIAVSIAAQMIRERNKDLPTGRTALTHK